MLEIFSNGGEMGAIMRATDWSQTRLGPPELWPRSLKTMLGVVLGSRFPMLLWWGPDLLHLYNDAYRPILRDKHPASLAAPAAEIWAEVWEVAGPMARSVLAGGPATWTEDLQLFISSGGMAEETYFTFSYSPVPGDDGKVGGILNTVQETTEKVQAERQIRLLHDLAAQVSLEKSTESAYQTAAQVLAGDELDLPFALIYDFPDNSPQPQFRAGTLADPRLTDPLQWPLAELHQGREIVVELNHLPWLLPGKWNARPERAILLPLGPSGALIAGVSPHRRLDDRYRRFFLATAQQLGTVVANVQANELERKRAERLAELDRAKTAFFSNVSHEFRTPLTLMLGPMEEALSSPAQILQGANLQAIHRNTLRLLRLVNSLLDFSRIEAGRLKGTFSPVDLAAITADLASSFRSLLEKSGIQLIVNCPTLPEPIYVDITHWEKIVLNLLSNAYKFTFAGEIEVSLRWDEDAVVLAVRDTGTGIPAPALERVFERFYQVQEARGRSFEGSGIGLSLVRELARHHGGEVRARSRVGQGSTFEVVIPTGSAHLPAEQIQSRSLARAWECPTAAAFLLEADQWNEPVSNSGAQSPTRGPRILVVDDNADMRLYLTRLLSSKTRDGVHYQVETACDGVAALELARENPPDLILSDVMMPGLDGIGLLQALRRQSETREIPIILLSARAGEESVLEGLEFGADDYLTKPFSAQELFARVQTHLNIARMRNSWARELAQVNRELETFSYSVSHDLRAPLRAIDGFTQAVLRDYEDSLSESARKNLQRVRDAAQRMAKLIEDLLGLARIGQSKVTRAPVDLTDLSRRLLSEIEAQNPQRQVTIQVADGLKTQADPGLVAVLLENLLGNAWKFTGKRESAQIEVGQEDNVFFVRDNGAGFDAKYASKLFAPFQRLHREAEFPGTGIGLATVQRIVARHEGKIWAQADEGNGATFYFTLGQ